MLQNSIILIVRTIEGQPGGLVVERLPVLLKVLGLIPGLVTIYWQTFKSTIQAGCHSNETLNWRSLVSVSIECRYEVTPYSQRAHLNHLTVGSFEDIQLAHSELTRLAHTVSLL